MKQDLEIIEEILGHSGSMIAGSKSSYRRSFPNNNPIFNANLFLDGKKIWWGDLDLTLDEENLKEIAEKTGKELRILREMDARFENEENPDLEKSVLTILGSLV